MVAGPRHQIRLKLLALAFACAAGLILLEVALHLAGIRPGGKTERGDPELGYAPQPNTLTPVRFFEYANGFIPMKTNNLGLVEETPTEIAKAPGVMRIAIVGDSETQGACADSESYPNQLERLLNASPSGGARYEVLNGGVSRYSPYQYLLRTRRVIFPLGCDQLVVGLYLGNDLQDMIRHDDRPYASIGTDGRLENHPPEWITVEDPRGTRPFLERTRVGSILYRQAYRPLRFRIIQAHSAYANMPRENRSLRSAWDYLHHLRVLNGIGHGLMAQSAYQLIYFEFFPQAKAEALRLNEALMGAFAEECAQHGCALTYVLIPGKMSVEPEDAAEMMARATRIDPNLTVDRLQNLEEEYRQAMLETANRLGVSVIDLKPEMVRLRAGRRLYYQWDMHLNATGNQVVAEILAGHLRDRPRPAPVTTQASAATATGSPTGTP